MATPITHVVLANKIFTNFFNGKTKKDFFIGTLFPDIRLLKVIERDKTHFNGLKLADLASDNSFMAGVKFHSILDLAREKFIVESGIYDLCPESKFTIAVVKLLEDQLFYDRIDAWNEYIGYLDEVNIDEVNFGINENDISKWHRILQEYFKKLPDKETIIDLVLAIGFSNEQALEINKNLDIIRSNKLIIEKLEKMYHNFENLIK